MAVIVCSVYITMASTVNEHGCVVVMKAYTRLRGITIFSSLSYSHFLFISFCSGNMMKNAKSELLVSIECSAIKKQYTFILILKERMCRLR
jgi:hypothetical protein